MLYPAKNWNYFFLVKGRQVFIYILQESAGITKQTTEYLGSGTIHIELMLHLRRTINPQALARGSFEEMGPFYEQHDCASV